MEQTITLLLTDAEAGTLIQLIDLAVKAGGIQVAGPAVNLAAKIQAAAAPKAE